MATLTEEGKILAARDMSPEQAQGQRVERAQRHFRVRRSAVLKEMLTGQQAFQRGNTASTLAAILRDDTSPSAALERTVCRTMSRNSAALSAEAP